MKRLIGILLCIVLIASSLAGCAGTNAASDAPAQAPETDAGQPAEGSTEALEKGSIKILFADGAAPGQSTYTVNVDFIEPELEKRSNGVIDFVYYPDKSLGTDTEIADAVINGDLTMGNPTCSSLAPYAPELNVLDAPFLFNNSEEAYATLDSDVGRQLHAALNKAGLQGIAFGENGFRILTANTEVHGVADVKGLKIRTMENEIHLAFWNALGANPSPLPFAEVYTALQQKTFDAQENPYNNIASNKLYEVQKYMIETNHLYSPTLIYCNLEWWNSLPEEYQQIILDVFQEGVEMQREISQDMVDQQRQECIDGGATVITLTPDELAEFREAASAVYDRISELAGAEMWDAFYAEAMSHK